MASSKKVALIKQKNQGTVQINTCVEDPQKSIEELIQKSLEEHKRPPHFERNLNRPKLPSSFNSRPSNKRGSSAHSREGSSDDGFGSGRQTSPSSISSSNVGGGGGHFSNYQSVHTRQTSAPALIGYDAMDQMPPSTSRPPLHSAGLPPICYPHNKNKSVSTAAIPGIVNEVGSNDGYMMGSPETAQLNPVHQRSTRSCDISAFTPPMSQNYSMTPNEEGFYTDPKHVYMNQRAISHSLDHMTVMSGSNPQMYQGSPTISGVMPHPGQIYGQYQSPTQHSPYHSNQQIPTNPIDDGLGALPDGWMKAFDPNGEPYFIDHNNKNTTWYDPRLPREVQEAQIQQRHAISSRANTKPGMIVQPPSQSYPVPMHQQPPPQQQAPIYSNMDSVQKLNMERNYMIERQHQLQQQGLLPPQNQQQQLMNMPQFGSVPQHSQYLHPTSHSSSMMASTGHYRSISNDSALDNTMEVEYAHGIPNPSTLPPNMLHDVVTINPHEFDRYLQINEGHLPTTMSK